jgi:hypothetical protein
LGATLWKSNAEPLLHSLLRAHEETWREALGLEPGLERLLEILLGAGLEDLLGTLCGVLLGNLIGTGLRIRLEGFLGIGLETLLRTWREP